MEALIFLVLSLIVLVCFISLIFRIKTYFKVSENSGKINTILDLMNSIKPKPEKPKVVLPEKQGTPLAAKIPQKEIKIIEKPSAPSPPTPPPKPPPIHIKPITPKPDMRPMLAKSKSKMEIVPPLDSSIFTTTPSTESESAKEHLEKEPSKYESKVENILLRIWNWIVVGEEFRNKNLSLEYAIATTWLLRAAILFIVIGIGFLLKYSIDNAWLGPMGRVCLSILAGIVMLVGGLKLLKGKYRIIGQGLLGGSIAIFYFSAFASSVMYNLIPVNYAFAVMILITVASGILAVKLDSLLVAILGTIGGYLTPIMLSSGSKDLPTLFTYMLILGIGVLGIAKYKRWKLLNALSFIFTYLVFFAAMYKIYNVNIHFNITILFITLYFLMFSGITILYNLVNKEKSTVLELIGMFTNVAIYFITTYFLIRNLYPREYAAIVTLGLSAFYAAGIVCLIKRKIEDKALMVFLTGFTSFFVTITIPLLLSDKWLTSAWAIQALIFLWMSSKLKNRFLRGISYLIYFITFSKVFSVDLNRNFIGITTVNYTSELLSRFLTFGMMIISTGLGYRILKKESKSDSETNTPAAFFIWIASIFAFIFLHFEFYYFCDAFYKPLLSPLTSLIWVGFILIVVSKLATQKFRFKFMLIFLFFGLIIKLFFFDSFLSSNFLYGGHYGELFYMRLLNFVLITAIISYSYFVSTKSKFSVAPLFAFSALALLFLYSTFELNTFLHNYLPAFQSGGISILWALFAIAFVFSGIKTNLRTLRFTGLLLFIICALKVFFSDLSQLSSLYKIYASIAFGIVILAGAFIYVKFIENFSTSDENKIRQD